MTALELLKYALNLELPELSLHLLISRLQVNPQARRWREVLRVNLDI
jgi:hypothetical protein